ncbi:MAG: ZIP family metal transporter [Clostridia bacterium]|nr:ZIP family metal transporter [Clostridia bacterium]
MNHLWITVLGFSFIFLATALGAAVVFFFKGEISPKINAFFLGLASGVMIAASVWSLLLPAIEQSQTLFGALAFLPAVIGLFLGGVFLVLLDRVKPKNRESVRMQKHTRLFLAVTLHNIPEGLAVGFAFGAAAVLGETAAYLSALGLAIGIGIQNFPEGLAIALPIKTALNSRKRAFLWGTASGLPEPVFAVLGYFLASWLQILQPWLLAFSAGAMLFVAAEDLIPDSKMQSDSCVGAWGVLLGFILMMALDVALG